MENPTIANKTRKKGVPIRRTTPAYNNRGPLVAKGNHHVPINPAMNNVTLPHTPVRRAREVRSSTDNKGRDDVGCSVIIGKRIGSQR